MLVAIVGFGVTSSPQQDGYYRAITLASSSYSHTSGPYPGWFYGLPLAIVVALIAVAAAVALARVAASGRPTDESLRQVDRVMRVLHTRIIMKLTTGTFVTYLGGLLVLGGAATLSASNRLQNGVYVGVEPWHTLAPIELWSGVVLILVGLVLLMLAVIDAVRPPFTFRTTGGPFGSLPCSSWRIHCKRTGRGASSMASTAHSAAASSRPLRPKQPEEWW